MDIASSEVATDIAFPAVIRAKIGGVHCVYDACLSQEDLEAYLAEKQFRAGRDSFVAEDPSASGWS